MHAIDGSFFARLVGLGAIPLFSRELQAQAQIGHLKITAVELWQATGDQSVRAYLDEEYRRWMVSRLPHRGSGRRRRLLPAVSI